MEPKDFVSGLEAPNAKTSDDDGTIGVAIAVVVTGFAPNTNGAGLSVLADDEKALPKADVVADVAGEEAVAGVGAGLLLKLVFPNIDEGAPKTPKFEDGAGVGF